MEILARVLYGSQNYGLSNKFSDRDYKLIALPELDDLYYNRTLELPDEYDSEHFSMMDIRKWVQLLEKGNINAIEYLFSTGFSYYSHDLEFEKIMLELRHFFYYKRYLAAVWPGFFKSAKGMCLHNHQRNDYNRKTVSRTYWIMKFVQEVVNNDFNIPKDYFGKTVQNAYDIRYDGCIELNPNYYQDLGELLIKNLDSINKRALSKISERNPSYTNFFNNINSQIQQMIIERTE